jgi:hypothetical protein
VGETEGRADGDRVATVGTPVGCGVGGSDVHIFMSRLLSAPCSSEV